MMSSSDEEVLKHTLIFIHHLAQACSNSIFTLIYLERNLSDLIQPLAAEQVPFVSYYYDLSYDILVHIGLSQGTRVSYP